MTRLTFSDKCIAVGIYNPPDYIKKLYQKGLSCKEISELLFNKYKISITSKSISDKIKCQIPLRTYSERKINAIKRGRMVYYKDNGLSVEKRIKALEEAVMTLQSLQKKDLS